MDENKYLPGENTEEVTEEAPAEAEEIQAEAAAAEEAPAETEEIQEEEIREEESEAEEQAETEPEVKNVQQEPSKGMAYRQPEHIGKKNSWNATTTIVLVAAIVVILGILCVFAYHFNILGTQKFFKSVFGSKDKLIYSVTSDSGKVEERSLKKADYTSVTVNKSDVEVTDEDVQSEIDSILSEYQVTETLTTGTVEEGDTVCIDYVGVLKGETEPFDGGSAEDTDLEIGSGTFIDGFEDGLIGKEVGSTVDLDLTFPEDYSAEELAGKEVTFTVTINDKTTTTTPELTDEWVKENSLDAVGESFDTVDALKEYIYNDLYKDNLYNAIYSAIDEITEAKSYNAITEEDLKDYVASQLSYYAYYYSTSADVFASYMGYDSADEYEEYYAHLYQKTQMIADRIIKDYKISYTDDEFDKHLEHYKNYEDDYGEYYSDLDSYKEAMGDTWMWLYENLNYRYELAMEAIANEIQIVDDTATTEAETTAAE